MARDRDAATSVGEVAVWLLFFVLLVPAGLVGWAIGHSTRSENSATTTGQQRGAMLAVASIGDPAKGQALFVSKHCSDCHSYNGHGGTDAPALDSMRGQLSAREIAEMSGMIWNHLPRMLPHFEEEGVPLPNFSAGQMADLIAYLHGGAPKGMTQSMTGATTMNMSTTMHMRTTTATGK